MCENKLEQLKEEFRRLDTEWYNKFYALDKQEDGGYTLDPEQSTYAVVWNIILSWISDKECIADFGCGVGQFAQLAIRRGKKYVYGTDYSSVAINLAVIRNPSHAACFEVNDLRSAVACALTDYDVAIFTEVLEHLENDLGALANVPIGRRAIVTIPSFDYISHYRHFDTIEMCIERYSKVLTIHKAIGVLCMPFSECMKIWILDGIRIGSEHANA